MQHTFSILLSLFLVFVAAQIGAEIAQRLRLPAVVGEIAAGCVIGPSLLNWVQISEPLSTLSEIGAVLLLFSVGLENQIGDLRKVGVRAGLVGVAGVIVPFVLGTAWAKFAGFSTPHALFIASAFVATSAGITARVLQELGALSRIESRIILGAAVIDDILAMLLLGVVTALQGGGHVRFAHLAVVLAQAVGFLTIVALTGTGLMRRKSEVLDAPISPHSALTLSLALCLGLAALASKIGLAAIIGAFLAGLVVAESRQRHALEAQIQPLMAFLVPFFFVVTGTQVQLRELASFPALMMLLVITSLAAVGKLVGCGLGAWTLGHKSALIIGVGMIPRGEVGIIVASLGRAAGLFSAQIYAVLIAMSLMTSVIAPPLLKRLLTDTERTEEMQADAPVPNSESLLTAVEETGHDVAAR